MQMSALKHKLAHYVRYKSGRTADNNMENTPVMWEPVCDRWLDFESHYLLSKALF